MSKEQSTPWWRFTNVRIWWWKWRYVERILSRAMPARSSKDIESAWYLADCGWESALDWCDNDVEKALKESPKDSADSELSYWTE